MKLLRFVQTGSFAPVGSSRAEKVDVRFVCATNRDPLAEVEAGRFREDLYYRLYVVPVELPPLRARGGDVLQIAGEFLRAFAGEEGKSFRGFAPETEAALLRYPWPGNVRQLQNVIRNIVVLHEGEVVQPAMLPAMLLRAAAPVGSPGTAPPRPLPELVAIGAGPAEAAMAAPPLPPMAPPPVAPPATLAASLPPAPPALPSEPPPAHVTAPPARPDAAPPAGPDATPARDAAAAPPEIEPLAELEKRMILAALARTNKDVPRAAALLKVNPSTIYRKLQAWRAEGED